MKLDFVIASHARAIRLGVLGLVLVAFSLLAALPASAQVLQPGEARVNWTNPTTFEGGLPLAAEQLEALRVEWGSCAAPQVFGAAIGEMSVPAPATSALITGLAPGTYCIRVYARATSAAGGLESGPSNTDGKTIAWPAPSPPAVVTVTVR